MSTTGERQNMMVDYVLERIEAIQDLAPAPPSAHDRDAGDAAWRYAIERTCLAMLRDELDLGDQGDPSRLLRRVREYEAYVVGLSDRQQ